MTGLKAVENEVGIAECESCRAPQFVTLPGGTIARYQEFSASGAAASEALLLLHGGSVSLESWMPWIARLAGTRRIVAVDLPGHGLTGATREGDYGAEGMTDFVEAVVEALAFQGGFVLVGHSMGGHVAWRFALRHPDQVHKLILIAPAGLAALRGPQGKAAKLVSLPGGSLILRLVTTRARLAGGLRQVFHDPAKMTDAMVDRYWAMNRRAGSMRAAIARLKLPGFEPAAIARLSDLKMPVLLLWGAEDIVCLPSLAQTIVQAVPSAQLVTYQNCGHFPHEEMPDETVRDLRAFLE